MPTLQSALAPIFEENFTARGDLGASVSVWREGREIVSLAGGFQDREHKRAWKPETPVLVYSATKGPAAACVLKCLRDAGISLDAPVGSVWPGFSQAGKEGVTFAEVLSHQAGVPALNDPPDVFDYAGVIRALERQPPLWPRSDGEHGYHPRTSGYLWDEIVRRVAGMPLGKYWRQKFAEPLGLDFWIGLPEERLADVSPLYASRTPPANDAFFRAFLEPGSLTHRAFSSPYGLFSVSSMNTAAARLTPFPAFGGIGSAPALAKFYAALACGRDGLLEAATRRLANGPDLVLHLDTAFSAGFLLDPLRADGGKLRCSFGPSQRAFGQVGAGGSVGFADPDRGLGFAYVMNQMEPGVLPNAKSLLLIERMYEALDSGNAE